MIEKRFYSQEKNALIYIEKDATPAFWDKHWETDNFVASIKRHNGFLSKITHKFLKNGSRILEGGCGTGRNVYTLQNSGYRVLGLDYAAKTVSMIKAHCPELSITTGDVRVLPFKENCFEGYWSLGVIEHFYFGYQDIAKEMVRVLSPGGYLFLTFPYMSPLRRLKARLGFYSEFKHNLESRCEGFYQFAMNSERTEKELSQYGFKLLHSESMDGVKGLKDELPFLKPFLQKIYDSRLFIFRVCKKILDMMLRRYCGHSVLLVLKLEK